MTSSPSSAPALPSPLGTTGNSYPPLDEILKGLSLPNQIQPYLAKDFNPVLYAHVLLNGGESQTGGGGVGSGAGGEGSTADGTVPGEAGSSTGTGSGGVPISSSSLTPFLTHINGQIKDLVDKNHERLLEVVKRGSGDEVERGVKRVRNGVEELGDGVGRLRQKISVPHTQLRTTLEMLDTLQRTGWMARKAHRFITLTRRLESQMAEIKRYSPSSSKEERKNSDSDSDSDDEDDGDGDGVGTSEERDRAMAEAALTLGELETLLGPPLASLPSTPSTTTGPTASFLPPTTPATASRKHNTASSNRPAASNGIEKDADAIHEKNEEVEREKKKLEVEIEEEDSLRNLDFIDSQLDRIEVWRDRVGRRMERGVAEGLGTVNPTLLASSLQVAHNLGVLPNLVAGLMGDLCDAIEGRIKIAFDMRDISREVSALPAAKGFVETTPVSSHLYKMRTRVEPTSANLSQYTQIFWKRMERMSDELGGCCVKVYTLEKVLKYRKDMVTQVSFLEESMTILEDKPSLIFWRTMSQVLESQAKESVKGSPFVQQTMTNTYPKLLRLFHDFFSTIAMHTDTSYTADQQSPETVLILRSISSFESLYLTRATNRLNEAVASAFTTSASTGQRLPINSFNGNPIPTASEGSACARTFTNELDGARFDPLMAKAVAKGVGRGIEAFVARCDNLISRDFAATSLAGPTATPAQKVNTDLVNALYHFWLPLNTAATEYPIAVREILKGYLQMAQSKYLSITMPLLASARRDFSAIIFRIHMVDFTQPPDPTGSSVYMEDLNEKLVFLKNELLRELKLDRLVGEWALSLSRHVLCLFLLHASLVKPLTESGKLKLTSDVTALEFGLSQFLSEFGMGLGRMGTGWFRAFRAFRPLLFTDNVTLISPTSEVTLSIPPLILIHHIIVRSSSTLTSNSSSTSIPIPLPHEKHGWSKAEYVRWVMEHDPSTVGLVNDNEENNEDGYGVGGRVIEEDEAKGVVGKSKDEFRLVERLAKEWLVTVEAHGNEADEREEEKEYAKMINHVLERWSRELEN